MAERKPLFMSADGYSQEMATADSMTLGGLTMGGNVIMGGNFITGLGDGVNPQDAVTKSQLDQAIISGGQIKEMVLCNNQLSDPQGILAAMAVFFANQPISGDTITITDGTTTRTYGAVAGGDAQFSIGATVADTMLNFAAVVTGDGLASWDAYFSNAMDEVNPAGIVIIVDDTSTVAAQNPIRTYGTFATQADLQVVEFSDGTTPDKDYSSNVATTASTTDPGNGRVGFQRQAAALVDGEIHYTRCNDVLYAWDDSSNVWQQMSGAGSVPTATSAPGGGIIGKVTADEDYGLSITAGILRIDLVPPGVGVGGLEFDGSGNVQVLADTAAGVELTAGGVAVDLAVTNPGLTFEGGDLAVLVSGSEGIVRTPTGIAIEIDPTPGTLAVGVDGLTVTGLPSLFTINDVAVGATVTAPNLDTLTNGSNADALHTHTGAENSQGDWNVDSAVSIGNPVYWTSTGDRVAPADAATLSTTQPFGVATTAQAVVGNPATVVSLGTAAGVLVGATPGTRYYLASGGGLTTSRPVGSGNRIISMGYAKNATDLWVEIQDFGRVA